MSCNWPRFTIQELIDSRVITLQKDGNHGSNYPRASEFGDKGVAFLTAKLLDDAGNIDFAQAPRLSEEKAAKFKFGFIEKDDVLLSHNATVGRVAIVPNYGENVLIGTSLTHYRLNSEKLIPQYLAAFFTSKDFQNQLAAVMSQTTRNQVPITAQRKLEVVIPPIKIQEQLTRISGSIIEKISINTQTNQTLEQMAQAIFKSWFVDFDPVKAKMNGEQPEGMDAATASLFPEKLVESELGLIPEGWEVSTLSSLIQLTGGGTPKRSEETYWNGDIPWFSVRDVPSGSNVFVVDTDEKITKLGLNKSSTKLLPKGTTIITARGTVGKLALVGTDMCMNQSCYGIRGKEVGDFYNYFNLNEAVSTLQRNTHGAVFDTITTKTFDTYSMAFSGAELANKFDALVAPLLQKIEANVRENIELAALRDTLLPKLLSGEVSLENEL